MGALVTQDSYFTSTGPKAAIFLYTIIFITVYCYRSFACSKD